MILCRVLLLVDVDDALPGFGIDSLTFMLAQWLSCEVDGAFID
jgi:hypothetical protein